MTGGAAPGVLVTRPEPDASALGAALRARGWRPVLSPLLEFAPAPCAPDLRGIGALVMTSAAGARAAPAGAALRALPVWAVGEATAAAARAAGFAQVRAGPSDAAALARAILAHAAPGNVLLHLRGRHGTAGLAEALAAGGLTLREAEVYRMGAAPGLSPEAEAALAARAIAAAPVYSPRTARLLAERLAGRFDPAAIAPIAAIAISAAAAAPLAGVGFGALEVAAAPTGAAMLDALSARLAANGGAPPQVSR